VDFGAKAATTATQGLGWLSPAFFARQRRTDNRAVNHHIFHIGGMGKIRKHLLPHARVAPASKAFVNAIPLAIVVRAASAIARRSQHPQHPFNKESVATAVPTPSSPADRRAGRLGFSSILRLAFLLFS
jgi:hypothetical protein